MDALLRITALVVLLGALGPIFLVACACRAFLYYPTSATPSALAVGRWKAVQLPVSPASTEIELQGLVSAPEPAEGEAEEAATWILFFGGNAMSLFDARTVLEQLAPERSVGLAAFAYRGYDGSGGRPTEAKLTSDAEAIATHLKSTYGVAPDHLVLVGQSLGTGIAANLAARLARSGHPPKGLGLISPYTSIARVFDDHVPIVPVGWAVSDSYRTDRLLPDLAPPIVIVHGTADEVIPIRHGRRLAERLGDRVQLVELPGLHHNDLWDDPRTLEALRTLLPASVRLP